VTAIIAEGRHRAYIRHYFGVKNFIQIPHSRKIV
jgi:hypothetical protein